jgi:GAF domain-containing protein
MLCPEHAVEAMKRRSRAGGKPAKARPRKALTVKGRNAPKAVSRLGSASAGRTEIARLTRELKEAQEQQAATADLLKVISQSGFNLQVVLDTLVQSAARLCEAEMASVVHPEGSVYRSFAHYGYSQNLIEFMETHPVHLGRGTVTGRTILECKPVQIPDVLADPEFTFTEGVKIGGMRTMLGVPLLRDGVPMGVFVLARRAVRPFSDKQIELVQNFSAQAVIAIENTRLLRELRESLQQQTATADVLKVISRSAFDLKVVLDALLRSAGRLCEADMGVIARRQDDRFYRTVSYGLPDDLTELIDDQPVELSRTSVSGRALLEGRVIQITDVEADPEYTHPSRGTGAFRTLVGVPMIREGVPVAVMTLARKSVQPFTDKQIELVSTFADQAAIAIENVRLFEAEQQRTRELSESLEQQTATSEVLQVISSSPGDLQPVFASMLEKAVRICDAKFGNIFRWDGDALHLVATNNTPPALAEARRRSPPTTRDPLIDRMVATKTVTHIPDLAAEPIYIKQRIPTHVAAVELGGIRTLLLVPMLKENQLIGVFSLYRQEVRPFADKQIALVTNFAAQAFIAIENARLLSELHERTDQLAAQSQELAKLNQQLEQRVANQVGEIERMGRLRRFLPPQVADLIVASGAEKQLESHRREITALFCDLRGFTGFSESSDPEDVMALLREYHVAIGEIIVRYSGTLERYAGDGVMVVFNDPIPVDNPALQAVLMALEMREAIGALTEKWRQLGHEIGFGIGIAHGYATLGTIGFEGRFDYAAIGTVSNVASRLCDEAKPGQILISPRVLMAVKDAVTVEAIGEFELKGIRRPIAAYNVLAATPTTH